jgi:hypothetical protein
MRIKYKYIFMKIYKILSIIIAISSFGCQKRSSEISGRGEFLIKLDSIMFNSNELLSGVGRFTIIRDTLYFFDQRKNTIQAIDHNTKKVIYSKLGSGPGPNEIQGIDYLWGNSNYNFIYYNSFLHCYNLNWTLKSKRRINFHGDQSYSDIVSDPNYKLSPQIYLPEYMELNPFSISDSISIIHVTAAHEQLNKYYHKEYYSKIKPFATVNVFSGEVMGVFGEKSSKLSEYNLLPNFDHSYFTVKSDTLIVSHEVDSKLYYYSIKGKKLKEIEISDNHKVGENFKERIGIESDDFYFADRAVSTYYTHIYHDNSMDVSFRVVKTGSNKDAKSKLDNPTFLQIVKEGKLIQEVKVPGRFRMIGKIGDVLYADGIIMENNTDTRIGIYTLKYN